MDSGGQRASYLNSSFEAHSGGVDMNGEEKGKRGWGPQAGSRVRGRPQRWLPPHHHDQAGMMQPEEKWLCLRSHPRSDCIKAHTGTTMTF